MMASRDRPSQREVELAYPGPGKLKRVGKELKGPCPVCGGTDRFYVRKDGGFFCRQGCAYEAMSKALGLWNKGIAGRRSARRTRRKTRTAPKTLEGNPARLKSNPEGVAVSNEVFDELVLDVLDRFRLGPKGQAFAKDRGLNPDSLEWVSAEGARERAALAKLAGYRFPGCAEEYDWSILPVRSATRGWQSFRVRRLSGGPVLTLKADKARLGGRETLSRMQNGTLHLVEGETDQASLQAAGAGAVVSLPGAGNLHREAVRIAVKSGARLTAIWLDGDRAGADATAKVSALLNRAGVRAQPVKLPPGQDANDIWRANPEAIRRAVRELETTTEGPNK